MNKKKPVSRTCRATCKLVVKLVLDPLFAISIVSGSYHYQRGGFDFARETGSNGRTPITPAAINEGERLYNQRADIYRDANARSVPDAARIIIRFYYRLTIGRDVARSIEKYLGRRHVRKQAMVSGLSRSSFWGGKRGRNSAGNCAAAGSRNGCRKFRRDEHRFHYRRCLGYI